MFFVCDRAKFLREPKEMEVWVVSGGIGCGKSTVMAGLQHLLEETGCVLFNADLVVHDELTRPETIRKVTQVFGRHILSDDGLIERSKLRARALGDSKLKTQLEQILHPLVRERFAESVADARSTSGGKGLLLAEIPLFHESNDSFFCDLSIMVAASPTTQRQRICASRSISTEQADAFIQAQLPIPKRWTGLMSFFGMMVLSRFCRSKSICWRGSGR